MTRLSSFCATAALAGFTLLATTANAEPVRTEAGLVDGDVQDGLRSYKGIPFAVPPLDDLRWRPPAPAAPWTGVKRATVFAPICEQLRDSPAAIRHSVTADERGLPLPERLDAGRSAGAHLPVMVWIYGGAFTGGGTAIPTYDGTNLAKEGVVVVSIAYRVGPLGFLAHPALSAELPAHASGTYGLMDQIAGLGWVQHNIAGFGGDPARVTIFGESAGAISVSMLAASPRAKGLFQRAISESGGSFAPPKDQPMEGGMTIPTLALAEHQGVNFLSKLGVKTVADARKLPAEAIVKAAGPQLGAFWPVLDGDVLPGDQYKLYEAGRYNDVPVLIGTNDDEGAPFVRSATIAEYTGGVKAAYGAYADKILAAYPAGTDAQALRSARDLFRDTAFGWPTWAWARLQARTGKSKVFVYYFTHRPPYPNWPLFRDWHAGHAADIPYVFGNPGVSVWSAADAALSDRMQTYWVNFATTGDPNGKGKPAWPAFGGQAPQELRLDDDVAPIAVPNLPQLTTLEGYYAWRRSQVGK